MTTELELVHLPPAELIIDTNVRTAVDVDPAFYESIRDFGVETPVDGWRDADGRVHVRRGQRRTLAAVQAGLASIPVIVRPLDLVQEAQDEEAAERERIVSQMRENDHRAALSDAEHLAAFQQLSLFGMSADDIAKATKTKRDRVRRAVKLVQQAPDAAAVMREHQLDLEQMAKITEFREHPDLTEQLVDAARSRPEQLDHEIVGARAALAERASLAALREEQEGLGRRVLDDDEWEAWLATDPDYRAPEEVRIGDEDEPPSPEQMQEQGGLIVAAQWNHVLEDGKYVVRYVPEYWVENPAEHGYRVLDDEPEHAPSAEDAEIIAARQERQRQVDAERRAWELADTVRHAWIRDTLLSDKRKLPAGAGMVILDGWISGGGILPEFDTYHNDAVIAARLLGLTGDPAKLPSPRSCAPDAQRARLGVLRELARGLGHERVLLALTLGRIESHLTLRHEERLAPYLILLQSWGYGLADIEHALIDQHAAALAADTDPEEA